MDFEKTCCFVGHRETQITGELRERVQKCIKELIINHSVDTFLFGSKSRFDDLCLEVMNEIKKEYPHIKRIYVRAHLPQITDDYKEYLLSWYDGTYYPEKIKSAGRASYVERNREMIDRSKFFVVYFDNNHTRKLSRKSGTELAYAYACKMKRQIINVFPVRK